MKKIITFIIALLAIATGAKADDRTEITLVEATSADYVTLPVVGASVEPHPTIQITTGAPAYFLTYMGGWWKKTGANTYSQVDEGLFTEGTWFYSCQLRVDGDAGNTHRLSENTVVKINGKTCETHNLTIEDDYSWCYVVWPEVTVEEPKSGNLGTQGTWRFKNGVLTVDYIGAMPISTKTDTNPETAFRLKWIDFLSEIEEVVVTGADVEIQPYFLYYEGDGPSGSHPDDHIKKVTLSSGVKSIGRQALAIYDLKQLCCYGMTPPELASYNTSNIHCFWKTRVEANRAFLVLLPGASVNYALANTEWMIFANVGGGFLSNLHPEDDPVGIKLIDNGQLTMDKEGASAWFDLSGRKLSGKPVQKGIYVNGGRKVLVK
jgi:hypothetical protein